MKPTPTMKEGPSVMEKVDFYWRPKCSTYEGDDRCGNPAEVWIVAPDGKDVPGSWACRKHGHRCVTEYRRKLKETWTLRLLVVKEG